jgi:CheY-like chemotaxis protein
VRIAQVLANLLNNASKYTDRGGRIWLTAEEDGSEIVLRVRDTGVGIAADQLPRVFDLFTQLDRTYDRAQGGLGIGLTLVRSLVELHGGQVEAHSEGPGRGSEFVVRLPGHLTPPLPDPTSDCDPLPAAEHRRVLVVDDNADSADSLRMVLELHGAEVRVAYDGASALTLVPEFRPTIALVDLGMPGMDGHEVARRIRRMEEGKDIVLVALTGWGQPDDVRRSLDAGMDEHLVKPVQLEQIATLLGSHGPA